MKKKFYNEPSILLIALSTADVITISTVDVATFENEEFIVSFGDFEELY